MTKEQQLKLADNLDALALKLSEDQNDLNGRIWIEGKLQGIAEMLRLTIPKE